MQNLVLINVEAIEELIRIGRDIKKMIEDETLKKISLMSRP